ncbi:unnamed protein product [Nesidiocoris tenuis]|uniref:Uncharacterized protein n=1 Tax=Nesidiocoris tenuis TaxID=355587 RepID=A0A6H5HQ97_9HEMI|nr:unnamed protein product [Nesidiocoris tenuis]
MSATAERCTTELRRDKVDTRHLNVIQTLPRIAAVAPHILTNLYHTRNAKTIFELSRLRPNPKPVLGTTFLASCFAHAAINLNRRVHSVLLSVHVLSDRIIHRKIAKYTEFNDMVNYYLAAVRSNGLKWTKNSNGAPSGA